MYCAVTWPQYPHREPEMCPVREIPVYAFDVNPEQVGIYQTIDLITDPINPPTSPTEQEASGMTIIDSSAGFGPDTDDAGSKAREKLALTGAAIKRKALLMWMWIKIITFLAVCGIVAFGYYSYQHRVKTYVTDHRPCMVEAEDKSWKVTGSRAYSYQNNELFGFRWSEAAAVEEKTELDVTGNLMVGGAYEGGYWWVAVTDKTTRPVYLKPASLLIFMANNKMLITNNETFCK
jgi:hypothetical protein